MEDVSITPREKEYVYCEKVEEKLYDDPVLSNEPNDLAQTSQEQHESTFEESKTQLINQFTLTSQEMAQSSPKIKGAIQIHELGEDTSSVRDIGWHKSTTEIPDPLIGGIANRKLFSMIRRFNKDVFSIKTAPSLNATGLDLNDAKSDKYASDKLKLNLERLYLTLILGLASFGKHISRLRSWKETRRTTAFFSAYYVAWMLDLLVPLFLGTLVILVSSEELRNLLFPPAPRALVSLTTGGLQKPKAGQLGTVDTLTGAPEKEYGEAVGEEAAGFVQNLQHLVLRAVREHKYPGQIDPLKGHFQGHNTQQTSLPMEEIIWTKTNPEILKFKIRQISLLLGEFVDNWERVANTISPTVPFSEKSFIRIDVALMPLFLISFFVTNDQMFKLVSFGLGFIFFGDPIITPALAWLDCQFPDWTRILQPKNNIFRGVPTNIQSTLTLLRMGEANNTPLPPVPTANENDINKTPNVNLDDIPLGNTRAEKVEAMIASGTNKTSTNDTACLPKNKIHSRISSFFKRNTRAVMVSKMAVDKIRATTGSEDAKDNLGILPKAKDLIFSGPLKFKARYQGVNGWLFLTKVIYPTLTFSTHDLQADAIIDAKVEINVEKISELRRSAAFTKEMAELVVGWSSGKERELLGGLEIAVCIDNDCDNANNDIGKVFKFTSLPERDELFNRLVAMGHQRWEIV
ncbi:hypothetical protein K3495_g131 [Podosphaera aphanis]|nr:hypothetical protein K3495_g131 [Podosphaera aphanis]